ncbi:MAG: hypothetical protein ACJAYU_002372 [Bradymonadia bacterium]|jgi:hypothetical protein
MAGGSGAAQLIKRTRRQERRGDRDGSKRRQKSRARSIAKNRARAADDPLQNRREEFACEFLCADCGYLLGEPAPRCPSCKSEDILDLGDVEVAARFRELEEAGRAARVPRGTWVAGGAAALVGAAAAALVHPLFGLGLLIGLPAALSQLLPRLYWSQLKSGLVPSRWRLPAMAQIADTTPARPTTADHARGAELLVSPVTNTPCIAWRVSVFVLRRDRAPELVLDENRAGALNVGGHTLHADSYLVDQTTAAIATDLAPAQPYLRTRGLFTSDEDFSLYEAVLREGEWVELCEGNPSLIRRTMPALD